MNHENGAFYMLTKMEVYFDGECWCARGINEDVFTQGKNINELMRNIKEAVEIHHDIT